MKSVPTIVTSVLRAIPVNALCCAVGLSTVAASANAQELRIVPSVWLGYKNVSHDNTYTAPTADGPFRWDGDVDASMPTGALGVALIAGKFTASLKYETELSEGSGDSTVAFTNIDPGQPAVDTDVERSDASLLLSYRLTDAFSINGGYIDGETTLTPECSRNEVGINLSCVAEDLGGAEYKQTYSEDGFVLGGAYRWTITERGSLTLSAAYAWLDSEYRDNYFPDQDLDFFFTGDADGYSVSAAWTHIMNRNWGYTVDLRAQSFDADYDDANGNFPGAGGSSDEEIVSVSAGIFYIF